MQAAQQSTVNSKYNYEAQEKPFVYHEPTYRTPDFDIECLNDGMGFVGCTRLMNDSRQLKEVLNDNATPVLFISGTVWRELQYFVKTRRSSEFAVFCMLKRASADKPHWIAYDWFMPGQRASRSHVDIDAEDLRKYFRALSENEYYKENGLQCYLMHLHSHHTMGVFWSSIDAEQQETRSELGYMGDYRFYAVIDSYGGSKCSFVTYNPVFHRYDNVEVIIYTALDIYNNTPDAARLKELDEIWDDNVRSAHESLMKSEFKTESASASKAEPLYAHKPSWSEWKPAGNLSGGSLYSYDDYYEGRIGYTHSDPYVGRCAPVPVPAAQAKAHDDDDEEVEEAFTQYEDMNEYLESVSFLNDMALQTEEMLGEKLVKVAAGSAIDEKTIMNIVCSAGSDGTMKKLLAGGKLALVDGGGVFDAYELIRASTLVRCYGWDDTETSGAVTDKALLEASEAIYDKITE